MRSRVRAEVRCFMVLMLAAGSLVPTARSAFASTWAIGDVVVSQTNNPPSHYDVYSNSGTYKESISQGAALSPEATGCAFNGVFDLWTTNFDDTKVVKIAGAHPHAVLQTIDTAPLSANGNSESVVVAANGDFFVGHAGGNGDILRYNSAGVFQRAYNVAIEDRGSDWLDLARNQRTMFYTSEGRLIKRYDVQTATQLPNFTRLPGEGVAYALRLLPPFDGTGGLLIADRDNIKRVSATGAVIRTYDAPDENGWFAINLDPNGTSFWSGGYSAEFPPSIGRRLYRFNIATGAREVGPIDTGSTIGGICVKGELTAALTPGISINDVSVTEGNSGTTPATFTLSLTQPTPYQVTVSYSTANGSALAGSDYVATSGTVTFQPGEVTKSITVGVIGDVADEPTERFLVNLSAPRNGYLLDGQGVGTILDDDRGGRFTCAADAFTAPLSFNPAAVAHNPCVDDARTYQEINVSSLIASAFHAATEEEPNDLRLRPVRVGDSASAYARAGLVQIKLPTGDILRVTAADARARAVCLSIGPPPTLSGSGAVGRVEIVGRGPLEIGATPTDIPLGAGTLHLNYTAISGTQLVRRAVWLESPLGNVVVAEARAGYVGNPCV